MPKHTRAHQNTHTHTHPHPHTHTHTQYIHKQTTHTLFPPTQIVCLWWDLHIPHSSQFQRSFPFLCLLTQRTRTTDNISISLPWSMSPPPPHRRTGCADKT